MTVLLGVIALFALMSLIAAVVQAMAMVRLAPASEHLASFMPLGWFKFGQLATKAGPQAASHINLYKRAVIAFLVFLLLGVILSTWTVNQRPPATASIFTQHQPAAFAHNVDPRRVAIVPGANLLES